MSIGYLQFLDMDVSFQDFDDGVIKNYHYDGKSGEVDIRIVLS